MVLYPCSSVTLLSATVPCTSVSASTFYSVTQFCVTVKSFNLDNDGVSCVCTPGSMLLSKSACCMCLVHNTRTGMPRTIFLGI